MLQNVRWIRHANPHHATFWNYLHQFPQQFGQGFSYITAICSSIFTCYPYFDYPLCIGHHIIQKLDLQTWVFGNWCYLQMIEQLFFWSLRQNSYLDLHVRAWFCSMYMHSSICNINGSRFYQYWIIQTTLSHPVLMLIISIKGFLLIFGKSSRAPPCFFPFSLFWPNSRTVLPEVALVVTLCCKTCRSNLANHTFQRLLNNFNDAVNLLYTN